MNLLSLFFEFEKENGLMFTELLDSVTKSAENKYNFFKQNKTGYLLSSIWAGAAIGLGMILISVIGAIGEANKYPMTKVLIGFAFSMALSIVIMVGLELFTGNNLVMFIGLVQNKFRFLDFIKIGFVNYIFNYIGAFFLSVLYINTGVKGTITADYILNLTVSKTSPDFLSLVAKGILCNVMVCLAVLVCLKLQNEVAKLIMIFWCIFTFIICGFEHSIANMTLFSIAKLIDYSIPVSDLMHNLIPVTIGNIIGGSLFVGGSVYILGKRK